MFGSVEVSLSKLSESVRRAAEEMQLLGRALVLHGRERPVRYRRAVHRAYRRAGIEPPRRQRWRVVFTGTQAAPPSPWEITTSA